MSRTCSEGIDVMLSGELLDGLNVRGQVVGALYLLDHVRHLWETEVLKRASRPASRLRRPRAWAETARISAARTFLSGLSHLQAGCSSSYDWKWVGLERVLASGRAEGDQNADHWRLPINETALD